MMEKYRSWAPTTTSRVTKSPRDSVLLCGLILSVLLGGMLWNNSSTLIGTAHNHFKQSVRLISSDRQAFDWEVIEPSKHLVWHPCIERNNVTFECARLSAPLDYFNGTTDAEVALALIRVPAGVPPTDDRYGGAILFNPGGPGGSGVDFLSRAYPKLSAVTERDRADNTTKLFDHISFDPRGVGMSTPRVRCFASDLLSFTWSLRVLQEGILGSSDAAFGRLWSMATARSGACSLSAKDDDEDIKKFVSTASVATDMITIIERHGEWRDAESRRLLAVSEPASELPAHLSYQAGHEKLNYWGFSYGTFLGTTFASMYPERVGRLIIDGVVDADDYKQGLWADNLADAERDMQQFYKYCAKAGYPKCAIANRHGSTTKDEIEARVQNITNSLLHDPLPVLEPYAEIITYSDVKNSIFVALYTPIKSFPLVAQALHDIEHGNGTIMAQLLKPLHQYRTHDQLVNPSIGLASNSTPDPLSRDATIAIACSDGDSQDFLTRELFREHWHNLTKISPTIGPMWSLHRANCIHYSVRSSYRFTGPWTGNTSFPILLIGNSADPVTPVRNARKHAAGFKNAHVIEQGSSGHCSLAARSACTEQLINRYFQSGELPKDKDTFCEADEFPFLSESTVAEELGVQFASRADHGLHSPFMPVY